MSILKNEVFEMTIILFNILLVFIIFDILLLLIIYIKRRRLSDFFGSNDILFKSIMIVTVLVLIIVENNLLKLNSYYFEFINNYTQLELMTITDLFILSFIYKEIYNNVKNLKYLHIPLPKFIDRLTLSNNGDNNESCD